MELHALLAGIIGLAAAQILGTRDKDRLYIVTLILLFIVWGYLAVKTFTDPIYV